MVVWPTFRSSKLYTWPEVAMITIYHWTHTWANGELIHGAHDLESISRMFLYALHTSQKLKDYIWSQLGLRYMVKQIYGKHMAIGGPRSLQGNPWLKMISSHYKTLFIWTKSTRTVIGGYIGTWQFLFNHRYVFTRMMHFISKAHVRWGFKSPLTLGSKHLCNSRRCSN